MDCLRILYQRLAWLSTYWRWGYLKEEDCGCKCCEKRKHKESDYFKALRKGSF